jgi:hypothetical protein
MKKNIWHLAMRLFESRIGKTFVKSLWHLFLQKVQGQQFNVVTNGTR